jgi:DNA-binding GntR family transcriptional regulator
MVMVIEHGVPEPVWRQLADIIRARVESGEYAPRSMVPSITRLAQEHGIAEMTVRKALDHLKSEGVLIAVSGKGTFVAKR